MGSEIMELPLFIQALENARNNNMPALAQELLRDLTDAYFLALSKADSKAMERINALGDEIQSVPSKYVNSGPDVKNFVLKGEITPNNWKEMRYVEHTGKTFYRITEHEKYEEIFEKVKYRADTYKVINKIYYLNKEDGAYAFGHAAILLVNSEGNGTFYSYASQLSIELLVGLDVPAQMGKLYMTSDQIKSFLHTGKLKGIKDWKGNPYNEEGTDHYTGFILMPIPKNESDNDMYMKAEAIYQNPGNYNLFENNCNHTVQQILEKGELDFTPTQGSSIDEQNTMIDLFVGSNKISSVFAQIIKSSLDCTIPNSAFILGKILTIANDWSVGRLGNSS